MQIFMFLFLISLTNSNESILVRDTVIIDSVPFVKFCYGCSPRAAAMILWYWDPRDYGRLVDFFYDFQDSPKNIPNVIRELALAMHTDTMMGATYISNIGPGIIYVTDSLNDYDFQSQTSTQGGSWNQYNFSWIKNEIDNGRPCIWNVLHYYYQGQFINRSFCAIGYIIAPPDTFVIVKNFWGWADALPLWTYHNGTYSYDYVVTVVPGGANPNNIFITYPTDSGIVFQYNTSVDITWDSYGSDIDYVKLWYASTYDSIEWTLIDALAPNTGIYTWIVPGESLCARINLQAFSVLDSLEAADGSFYSFTTEPTGISEENTNITEFTFNVLPNVFTKRLSIEFSAPIAEPISLEIYDISGRLIRFLPINLCNQNKSVKSVCWNGTDNKGKKVSSGIYFVSLRQKNKISVKKVVRLIK